MMNEMQVFTNEQFGQVRTILIDGNPWFVATDVCQALEINRTQSRRLDEDEKGVYSTHTPGGEQNLLYVNESGLYTLVIGSRKPEAKQFKRWITHEVIPTIRKHGAYMTDSVLDQFLEQPEMIYSLAETLVSERDLREKLQRQLDEAQPKLKFFDAYIDPHGCTCLRNVAKLLNMRQNDFIRNLIGGKILFRDPTTGIPLPYGEYQDKGFFIVRDVRVHKGLLVQQTRVTPEGKAFLLEHFGIGKEAN